MRDFPEEGKGQQVAMGINLNLLERNYLGEVSDLGSFYSDSGKEPSYNNVIFRCTVYNYLQFILNAC